MTRRWRFNDSITNSLVLNASYEPIKIVNWQKAILLWLTNKVEVLEFHSVKVHSAHDSFLLPSVLKLKRFINNRFRQKVRFCRENVFKRDDHTCHYCYKKFPVKKLTIDHVLPLSRGGEHAWRNVVSACGKCNNKKANMTPDEANMPLLKIPFEPTYLPNRSIFVEGRSLPEVWYNYLGS